MRRWPSTGAAWGWLETLGPCILIRTTFERCRAVHQKSHGCGFCVAIVRKQHCCDVATMATQRGQVIAGFILGETLGVGTYGK